MRLVSPEEKIILVARSCGSVSWSEWSSVTFHCFAPLSVHLSSHLYDWTPVLLLSVMLFIPTVYFCRYAIQRDVYTTPSTGDGTGICSSFAFKATHSVANLATLSLDSATFQTPLAKKRLATNLATFGKTLATFQMSPVLSCEREILCYTSPCVCSDQWALAPAERSSTYQWPHGSWHRCESAEHVHTVLPQTNHLPASPLFEIKLFSLTFYLFFLSHALILLTVTEL